jgi:putative ABC transport system permease protein
MGVTQILVESFRSLAANRLRTVLTMLGIIIGIASVVLMLAVGDGIKAYIAKELQVLGSNLMIVFSNQKTGSGARQRTGTTLTLTQQDAEAIDALPSVKGAAPSLTAFAQVSFGNTNGNYQIIGTTPKMLEIRSWTIGRGLSFSEADVRSAQRVVIIGKKIAEDFFYKADPIGQTIRLDNQSFQVVGVLANEGQTLSGENAGELVIIPISAARVSLVRTPTPNTVYGIYVQAKTERQMKEAEADMTDLLRDRHRIMPEQPDDFGIMNLGSLVKAGEAIGTGLSIALGVVGAISLIVGGIGIMNIMLVSVTERTREIGIRMAIGAKPGDVLKQFLIEAIVICIIGGLIGIAGAAGLAALVSMSGKFNMPVTLSAVVIATTFATAVGLFFGYYPARRASKLQPVECLRYE